MFWFFKGCIACYMTGRNYLNKVSVALYMNLASQGSTFIFLCTKLIDMKQQVTSIRYALQLNLAPKKGSRLNENSWQIKS